MMKIFSQVIYVSIKKLIVIVIIHLLILETIFFFGRNKKHLQYKSYEKVKQWNFFDLKWFELSRRRAVNQSIVREKSYNEIPKKV